MEFVSKEPISRGWSVDKKYCASAPDGRKYFLRITPEGKGSDRQKLFAILKQLESQGLPMCRPLDIGRCDGGVYTLYTWIYGTDAEETIPAMTEKKQYAYGLEAGRLLKVIHSIPAPEGLDSWENRFNAKLDRNIRLYEKCPVKFEGAENIIGYINANRHLLIGRPQCFQHGDYHTGNMMIEGGRLVIIDFDRYDFGDPWEEFNRIVWCAQLSPRFASGMIDGYFEGGIPDELWPLLAMYVGGTAIASPVWAAYFDSDIEVMLRQANDVLTWYNGMKRTVPSWYRPEDW